MSINYQKLRFKQLIKTKYFKYKKKTVTKIQMKSVITRVIMTKI